MRELGRHGHDKDVPLQTNGGPDTSRAADAGDEDAVRARRPNSRRGFLSAIGTMGLASSISMTDAAHAQVVDGETGLVVMRQGLDGQWVVRDPSGRKVDTARSQSEGLQEAIDLAASGGHELHVLGGGQRRGEGRRPIIRCKGTVRIPPIEETCWRFGSVVLEIDGGDGDGLHFDTILHSQFIFGGAIHYRGNGAAVHLFPKTPLPRSDAVFAVDSEIYIFRILIEGGRNPAGFRISALNGPVVHVRANFLEIEGETGRVVHMGDGVHIVSPGPGRVITGNIISVVRLNQFTGAGLRIGDEGAPHQGVMERNRFEAHIMPNHRSAAGIVTSGRHDYHLVTLAREMETFASGIVLREQAGKSIFMIQKNDGQSKLIDRSKDKDCTFIPPQI